ncbi:hypothetical protein CW749_26900 [Vibrio sp. vnigr-6D03]|uniref:hypothetical protein n=1 Tax=Vibrio sp. vnigr-6D03 TaxID=2058088 RepID=UPI000C32A7BE|nr:hypothetical protein [Vibrio sp. vnigr-6D03]PKF76463.1 hypothetical protein CW749_26900 [Vibrio sp. vnigr-6D03]
MNRIKGVLPYLAGILIGILLWSLAELFFNSLRNADLKIIVAIIAAFGSLTTGLIIAIFTHSSQKSRELLAQKRMSERELRVQEKISERELILQRHVREREIEEAHRQKKVEIYNDFLKLVSAFMQGTNASNKKKMPNQQKILDEFEKFQNGILLWGGPKVIQAFLDYRKNSGEEQDSLTIFRHVDALYKSLREDIGLSNSGLENLELVQMYLSDPTEIDTLLSEA